MDAAVLFDLDETLHDRAASLRAFLIDQHRRWFLGQIEEEAFVGRFTRLDAHGSLPKAVLYPTLLAELGIDEPSGHILATEYSLRYHEFACPMAGAGDLLAALRRRGFKLGVVTNGWTDFQLRTVATIGIRDAIDAVLVSEAEGLRKPDARLFRRAAERLGVATASCLDIGDNPTADVLGAEAAGMRAIWLRRGIPWPDQHPPAQLHVDELTDVVELLR